MKQYADALSHELRAMQINVDPYLTVNTFATGTTIGLNTEKVRGLLASAQDAGIFDIAEAVPKAYANYCSLFLSGETVGMKPTMNFYEKTTDDKTFVGIGQQLVNINGVVGHFTYEDLSEEAGDVGSRSFYPPSAILSGDTASVMALWKPSDLLMCSDPDGGVASVIRNDVHNIKELSFLLRLKCTLTATQQPDNSTFMPFIYVWKIRPSMIFEGCLIRYGDGREFFKKGPGWMQYFNNSIPALDAHISTWYVPIGRVTMTNCTEFIYERATQGSSNKTFSIAVQSTNMTPVLMISLTNTQINTLRTINQAVNNA